MPARPAYVWGTGAPRREFLHVNDLADAAVFLMREYDSPEIVNVGTGADISIRELVEMICRVAGYRGGIVFDSSRPDGTPQQAAQRLEADRDGLETIGRAG